MAWEAVIGIECHVELQTASKMFCGCPVTFGAEPNTATCPVCLGLPGALPVPNRAAIEGILKIGAALECDIVEHSLFHRKNYFYPDLPKNYQISQYDVPLCVDGSIDVEVDGEMATIGITRVHMEEDTGKSTHMGGAGRIADADFSLLDFNRSGVPLVEIVTEPDIRSAEQARAYAAELQRIVRTLGVSDARLEEGSMRFDANISVRPGPDAPFGTRAEVKNVNSLRSLQRAVDHEVRRQIELLEKGGVVVQETRHWNEGTGTTSSMRSKEDSEDYRYFQEPDLLPLHVDAEWQAAVRGSLPELPAARRRRYVELGAEPMVAAVLVSVDGLGELFDGAVQGGADPRNVANWLTQEAVAHLRRIEADVMDTSLDGVALVELDAMVAAGDLSATAAKEVLVAVMEGEGAPREVAEARDLIQVSDVGALEVVLDEVLAADPETVERLTAGDMKPIGFLVGQVMRATGGKADPKLVQQLLRSRFSG
jgi:aspartyl-tRNA(Asn)/glutamyl-tRNA(Gln) amidotransferase subunit B